MSLHEDINNAIREEIDSLGGSIALSPTTLALAVQRKWATDQIDPHLQYASLEHIKAMARKALARRYEADGDENIVHQGDMFSGLLQDAYPLPIRDGADPIYKPRDDLTDAEVEWNIGQLRKSAAARLKHADALQAWADNRRGRLAA